MYVAKNHSEGPDKTVIGGELVIEAGATMTIEEGATVEGVITASVVDGLTSTSATSALSAKQGKVLNEKIPPVVDALDSEVATSALSAKQGKVLKDALDGKIAANVPLAAGEAPTKEEYDALITALIAAGLMEGAEEV
jgi:hypothetical protein